MFIVTDMDGEDLLSYFDSAYEFIKNSQEKSSVLVHWWVLKLPKNTKSYFNKSLMYL